MTEQTIEEKIQEIDELYEEEGLSDNVVEKLIEVNELTESIQEE